MEKKVWYPEDEHQEQIYNNNNNNNKTSSFTVNFDNQNWSFHENVVSSNIEVFIWTWFPARI